MPDPLSHRPIDATLSVTKAARVLGVHPNTVRAWSDRGRLRYFRINPRGDRRYRVADLQRFLTSAVGAPSAKAFGAHREGRASGPAARTPVPLDVAPAVELVQVADRHRVELRVLDAIAELIVDRGALDRTLLRAATLVRDAFDYRLVAIWELRGDRLIPSATVGEESRLVTERSASLGTPARALAAGHAIVMDPVEAARDWIPTLPSLQAEAAVPIPGPDGSQWGVLLVGSLERGCLTGADQEFLDSTSRHVAMAAHSSHLLEKAAQQLHRTEALRRVASDITSRLNLDEILAGLADHATVLFGADRVAVFLRQPDGHLHAPVSRGLSGAYLAAVRDFPSPSLPAAAVAERRPMFAVGYRHDPAGASVRAAVVQEGYDTLCTAPLFDGPDLLGLLNVYHDRPHPWDRDDLETIAAFAEQASIAIRTAQNYEQMATWAAQLQSIQQLGTRLNRLTSVREIGLAIATELRQLIDYHNVRVYRIFDEEDLIPVAMQGQVGEYSDETAEQLRVKVGQGITGWVAAHGVAQNLGDAAKDPRANTVPGTEPDLDESMLLAPMVFEDRVLGVLVLSKLGLGQFTEDDLRLLVIYASFAAQAMANADATEMLRSQSGALERQLSSQRILLQITESILGTLDPRAILDQIADRLAPLVRYDNLSIEVFDRGTQILRPLTAKGIHASEFLEPGKVGEHGIATWVLEHNEPQLIDDERADPRVLQFEATGPVEGSLIVVPIRGREGATGVLTLERLGREDAFTREEFELVQLFAAHVSIALQNAEIHSAVEDRARTDDLTGVLNHGTFQERLQRMVAAGQPFSLIMLDLDDFKSVNDTLGHQAGDRFLREVADAVRSALARDSDQVFRYGGDEFSVILAGTDAAGARLVAERVGQAVRSVGAIGTEWHRQAVTVSGSIGVATFPVDGDTPDRILLAADRACFVAKRSGRAKTRTAAETAGLLLEFELQAPTPVDPPSVAVLGHS